MWSKTLVLGLFLMSAGISHAQETPMFKKERQFSPTDTLPFIKVPEGEKPVELRSLEIRVVVMGLHAETTQVMHFYNPNNRVLEGSLIFPLADNAVVSGYGLDVDGQMVDGVVVPKKEARKILEAEERKGVDPGLMEQVQGNVYRTRLYPLPAQGSRTVKVVSVSDLTVQGNEAAFHLPLSHATQIDKVDLRIEVVQAPVEPDISGGPGNLILKQWQDRWVSETTLDKGVASEDLQIRLPRLPDQITTIEESGQNETFFSISRKIPETSDQPAWKPQRIAIAWDASGSHADIERDLDFLQALLSSWQDLTLDIAIFRNRGVEEKETFAIEKGNMKQLRQFLLQLPYDGGTSLSALDLATLPHPTDEAWLLFSDGLGTMDHGLPKMGDNPLITITSQAQSHAALMKHLANASNGLYLNLLRTKAADAARQLAQFKAPVSIATSSGVEAVHLVTGDNRITLVGRLKDPKGSITLSSAGKALETLEIDGEKASQGRIVARFWAGLEAQVTALIDDAASQKRLLELGRQYGLVTANTSLLVLENLEQYLAYDIEPPATLPEMRTTFHRMKGDRQKEKTQESKRKLDVVLGWWENRVKWWNTEFKVDPDRIQGKTKEILALEDDETRSFPAIAASPAPMEMEPTMMVSQSADAMGIEREKKAAPSAAKAAIAIKPWSPDTPYLKAIKQVKPDEAYATYLEQRRDYAQSPAFFLDSGDYFLKNGKPQLGLRVLSNLVETGLEDAALMRMYAWRLQQAEEFDLAIALFERVLRNRDDEPQSHRDLALALAERWQKNHTEADATRAMELLYNVILGEWNNFPEIELIALMELNRIIHLVSKADIAIPERIDHRFIQLLDLDIRISLSWDSDMTDVDLHVFEPTGEHAYYGHNQTQMGGLVSRDFTQGYGPEEYILKKALPGKYLIKVHYYGSHQQTVSGACTIIATVYTNYGREGEKKQVLTLRLDKPSNEEVVGEISINPK